MSESAIDLSVYALNSKNNLAVDDPTGFVTETVAHLTNSLQTNAEFFEFDFGLGKISAGEHFVEIHAYANTQEELDHINQTLSQLAYKNPTFDQNVTSSELPEN